MLAARRRKYEISKSGFTDHRFRRCHVGDDDHHFRRLHLSPSSSSSCSASLPPSRDGYPIPLECQLKIFLSAILREKASFQGSWDRPPRKALLSSHEGGRGKAPWFAPIPRPMDSGLFAVSLPVRRPEIRNSVLFNFVPFEIPTTRGA